MGSTNGTGRSPGCQHANQYELGRGPELDAAHLSPILAALSRLLGKRNIRLGGWHGTAVASPSRLREIEENDPEKGRFLRF